jgi:UMF1 family MFS transporter
VNSLRIGTEGRAQINRKHIFVWVLYDFANSVFPAVITATVFSVYFANHIVGNEAGLGDLWWGRVLSVSMLFVAVTSPLMGAIADKSGKRKRMLFFFTYLCIVCVSLFVTVQEGMILWGFILAVLANIGVEGALVYYNAYLPDIAPPGREGFISGVGFGVGYAGSAAGLLIALPLVTGEQYELTWISVAVFFALFSLPSFWGLPPDRRKDCSFGHAVSEAMSGLKGILKDVMNQPDLRRFLFAFFMYIDGINTVIYFAAIFASTTLGFSGRELIVLFLVIQASALAGAFALARPSDTWGPKRVITLTLILWSGIVFSAYFVHSKTFFFAVAVLAGTGLGVVQSASRAFMSALIPKGKEAEMFGFYAFCGKSSSIIGPLVFGMISYSLGGNQRVALFSVLVFFLLGLAVLRRVREPRLTPEGKREAPFS